MPKIFVSYRRDDDPNAAARLRDGLAARFGNASVFMDVDNLLAGQRFDLELAKALASCDVLIAVIGSRWMELLKARAGTEDRDYVREEIAAALARNIVVIPVRVGREGLLPALPRPQDLPEDIRDLVQFQKQDVAYERFSRDCTELIQAISAVRRTKLANRPSGPGYPIPWRAVAVSLAAFAAIAAAAVGIASLWPATSQAPVADTAASSPRGPTPATPVLPIDLKRLADERDRVVRAAELQAKATAEAQQFKLEQDRIAREKAASQTALATQRTATDKPRAAVAPLASTVPPGATSPATAAIRIGILHSLSGTMAIEETMLKDAMLMLIDEQNRKGGVLGRKLEAVVVDPASNWPLFAEKARELIGQHKVSAIFGAWTSVSRRSVLPVVRELGSILFYPAAYEGEDGERNVFYTGATPSQQALPAVDYLASSEGGSVKRWVLAGTDFGTARAINTIVEEHLASRGVARDDIMVSYTPFGHTDWGDVVADIRRFGSAGRKTAVLSTITGDANVSFFRELANQGVKPADIPVLALAVGEEDLAGTDARPFAGHLAARSYFMSVQTPENEAFVRRWQAFTKNPRRVTSDGMEAHYLGWNMWVRAVEKVGTAEPAKVIAALPGVEVPNLSGGVARMLPSHHVTKPLLIGEIRPDGQFDIVWRTRELLPNGVPKR